MHKLEIKKLNGAYLISLQQLAAKSLAVEFPDYTPKTKESLKETVFGVESLEKRLNSATEEIWGAFKDNNLAGFLIFSIPDAGVIQLSWLVVAKEYQKQGVGTALVEELQQYALKEGVHGVHLYSGEYTLDYYKRLGFEDVGVVPNGYYGVFDHYMVLKVQEPKEENFLK